MKRVPLIQWHREDNHQRVQLHDAGHNRIRGRHEFASVLVNFTHNTGNRRSDAALLDWASIRRNSNCLISISSAAVTQMRNDQFRLYTIDFLLTGMITFPELLQFSEFRTTQIHIGESELQSAFHVHAAAGHFQRCLEYIVRHHGDHVTRFYDIPFLFATLTPGRLPFPRRQRQCRDTVPCRLLWFASVA